MWTPRAPHLDLSLAGCEIIVNSSASHFSLRKIEIRYALLLEASRKCGGIYLWVANFGLSHGKHRHYHVEHILTVANFNRYSNQLGLDGDRLYYDGSGMVVVNGV